MITSKQLLVLTSAFLFAFASTQAAPKTLDIYFIDVEGGAATLIVTPQGESLLVDSGFAEDRDANRIAHVARDLAGLKQIDHYITTHWHRDHVGGIPRVVKLIPVKNFYDHGIPAVPAADVLPELLAGYRQASQGKSVTLKAGDEIKFAGGSKVRVKIMHSNALVVGEPAGSPQIKACGSDFKPIPEDTTDNANSLGILVSFGSFQFYDGGDVTWNVENKLVCPKDLVGPVDLFEANHHGAANSNNPALVKALSPRVAVIGNGPRKGGDAQTFITLKSVPAIEAIYQLHRNLQTTDNDNAPADFIANDAEACQGDFIKVSVSSNSKSYSVSIPDKKITREYATR
jgi:beta-lactamase superfamily II metal-dependent hydrolase